MVSINHFLRLKDIENVTVVVTVNTDINQLRDALESGFDVDTIIRIPYLNHQEDNNLFLEAIKV